MEETIINQRLAMKPYLFIALPSSEAFNDTENSARAVIEGGSVFHQRYRPKKIGRQKLSAVLARDERFVGQGICKICQLCWFCDFGVAEIGGLNPNVMMEIGLMMGFGKKVVFTLHLSHTRIEDIPFDLGNPMLVPYASTTRLSQSLEDKINFILLTQSRTTQVTRSASPRQVENARARNRRQN